MEAHPRTLKSVFRSDVRLTVPLFQRPYVWTAQADAILAKVARGKARLETVTRGRCNSRHFSLTWPG